VIEPAGPRRARSAGSAEAASEPAPAQAARHPLAILLAAALVGAVAGGAVGAGVTALVIGSQARTNPQVLNLRSGVTVNEESNTVQVVSTAQPAVVSVVTKVGAAGVSAGSGFVVTSDGNIVTSVRLIANSQTLTVLLPDGSKPRDARVVDFDCETGVAVLKLDNVSNLRTLSFGDSNALKLGQSLVAVGGPLGGGARRGIVSGLHRSVSVDDPLDPTRTDHLSDTLQTDAGGDQSSSGGPLLNVSGQVVGVAVAATSSRQPVTFGIASNDIQPEVEQIVQSGQLVLPWLGVDSTVVDAESAQLQNMAVGSQVKDVTLGSPADQAGIKPGDVITQLDAYKLDDAHPLPQVLRAQFKPSQRVTVSLWRAGSTSQVELGLGSQHPTCQ
jgi:S1-C subfamily serine protease